MPDGTRYIRVLAFDGRNLTFFDNMRPTRTETLPLARADHGVAKTLYQWRLCKAIIHDGVIVHLAPTRTRTPPIYEP